jgi:hypothetical protein
MAHSKIKPMFVRKYEYSGRYYPERIRPTAFQATQYRLPYRPQVITQPPPILVDKVLVQLISRIRNDIRKLQCAFEVPWNGKPRNG